MDLLVTSRLVIMISFIKYLRSFTRYEGVNTDSRKDILTHTRTTPLLNASSAYLDCEGIKLASDINLRL